MVPPRISIELGRNWLSGREDAVDGKRCEDFLDKNKKPASHASRALYIGGYNICRRSSFSFTGPVIALGDALCIRHPLLANG